MQLSKKDFLFVFERYKIDRNMPELTLGEMVGYGGFSTVFELFDGKRQLVLKVVSTSETIADTQKTIQYVYSERDTMLRCKNCRNIMPLLDFYEYAINAEFNNYIFFFVMPKLTVLTEYVKSKGISEKLIVDVTKDICSALSFCEDKKILHRDVKHSNIYVRYDINNEPEFILGDFGIARALPNQNGPVTGIGSFIAPEIHSGQPLYGRFNSDIYSLGMMLFFLTTKDYASEAFKKNPPAEFSAILRHVMIKAVDTDPAQRYQHASEILDELNDIAVSSIKRDNNPDSLVPMCKCALIDKDPKKALELALAGHQAGNDTCSRLYAYTLFSVYKNDMQKTSDALQILKSLILKGDDTAKCIYSLIGLDITDQSSPEYENYLRLMSSAAQGGCAIAQYYFGRWLFDGQMGLQKNETQGMELLLCSMKQNFAPALLYLKTRLENHDSRFCYSTETIEALNTELAGFNKTKIPEAIVMYI